MQDDSAVEAHDPVVYLTPDRSLPASDARDERAEMQCRATRATSRHRVGTTTPVGPGSCATGPAPAGAMSCVIGRVSRLTSTRRQPPIGQSRPRPKSRLRVGPDSRSHPDQSSRCGPRHPQPTPGDHHLDRTHLPPASPSTGTRETHPGRVRSHHRLQQFNPSSMTRTTTVNQRLGSPQFTTVLQRCFSD